jgi:malate dehydrogenase
MRRKKIAIIGGGQIGSILTLMATQKELGDVTIVDLPEQINPIKGKALDIDHLRPHIGADVKLSAGSDYHHIADADVVVVTAGIPRKPNMSREDLLDINLGIIKSVAEQIKQHCPEAFIIVATNPVDTMSYAFQRVSGFPRSKVVGLSGVLDTGRFQHFIAQETGLSVKDVSCMVMGGHGPTMMPLIRTATISGIPIANLLQAEQIENIVKRTKEAGTEIVNLLGNGSAYFSSAASIIEMIEAYLGDKKRVISSSALCQGEYGLDGYYLGVPCVIGAAGVERIIEVELTAEESTSLENTATEVIKSIKQSGL